MKLAEKGSGAFEEAPYRIDPILSKVFVPLLYQGHFFEKYLRVDESFSKKISLYLSKHTYLEKLTV